MWDCTPGAREEAVLRLGLLAAHPDLDGQVTASGLVLLETKRGGVRPHGLGLLAATATSLIYFESQGTTLVFTWDEISDLKVRRKLFGCRITFLVGDQVIKLADDSRLLAPAIEQAWLNRQSG